MKSIYSALALVAATSLASAQTPMTPVDGPSARVILVHHEDNANIAPVQVMTSLPAESWAFTQWQKHSVYDLSDTKIGDVMDILMDHDGKPTALIIGVGGFLGVGEKDVAVPFNAVHFKKKDKNQEWQLVMNASKDALKNAPGFKYDRTAMTWMPENSASTVGNAPRSR